MANNNIFFASDLAAVATVVAAVAFVVPNIYVTYKLHNE